MFSLEELVAAQGLIRATIPPTPAHSWPLLARRLDGAVVVKHENHTPTGAFKVRGGITYLDGLLRDGSGSNGVIAATRGNHGQSIAFAATRLGIPATIVVPQGNSVEKNAAMRAFGAELIEHGEDFQAALEQASRLAEERALHMVPSFHRDLVVGVATYAFELLDQHRDIDTLYVPIGLGSGICACIMVRDLLGLKTRIVGVQAEGAPAYALSFSAGRTVATDASVTFADGMATRVPDEEALAIILAGAERIVTVSEDEIAHAIRWYWTDTHNLAEGAGAAPLAAAFKERARNRGQCIGLILSGGNIDLGTFNKHVAHAKVADAA